MIAREDTSRRDQEQEQEQDLPPRATFYTIQPPPPTRPRTPSSIAAQDQTPPTAFYASTPTPAARLTAISMDPELSKRQKKRHLKKQRKRNFLLGDEPEPEPAPAPEPKMYNATNTDDFPLLGSSPPPPSRRTLAENVATRGETRRIALVSNKMDGHASPLQIHRHRRGQTASTSTSTSASTFTSAHPPTHPAAMRMNPPRRPSHTRPTSASTAAHAAGSSRSWVSGPSALKDKFDRIQKNASHLGLLNSNVFPQTVGEYARHLAEVKQEGIVAEQKKIGRMLQERREASLREKRDLLVLGRYGVEVLERDGAGESESGGKYQASKNTGDGVESAFTTGVWSTETPNGRRDERSDFSKGDISLPVDETTLWHPSYEQRPEKNGGSRHLSRAAWPDQNELKAEGEMRARIFGERRLPLPRLYRFSEDAFANRFEKGATLEELENVKGEDIPWFERDLVNFTGLDILESIERERVSQARTWTHEGVSTPTMDQSYGGSRRQSSHSPRETGLVRGGGDPRDMTSMMGGGGMNSPGYAVDALTASFASMSSPEFRGHGAQRRVEPSREHRSISGSQAGRSPWGGREEELSEMYRQYIHAERHTPPSNLQSQFGMPNEPNYESLAWGADGYGDGKSPPPGGWKFDEQYLKERGWDDILKEL